MEVVLRKDVPNVGRMGDMVRVRDGFARNYLLPRSLAVTANHANKRALEHQKRLIEQQKKKVKGESEAQAKELSGIRVQLERRFNASGKMFGSVTAAQIALELGQKGFQIDKKDLVFESIRTSGNHSIQARLPGDVYADFQVEVVASPEKEKATAKKAKKKTSSSKSKKSAEEAEETSE